MISLQNRDHNFYPVIKSKTFSPLNLIILLMPENYLIGILIKIRDKAVEERFLLGERSFFWPLSTVEYLYLTNQTTPVSIETGVAFFNGKLRSRLSILYNFSGNFTIFSENRGFSGNSFGFWR